MASGTGRKKVVVVGAGFGGLSVCKHLGNRGCDVTLVDRNNYHGFWPLLYQVATGALDSASIAYPIRGIIRPYKNVDFVLGNVTGVDFDKKEVNVENGKPLPYDFLVLAAGSAQFYFGNNALASSTFSMKDVDEAEEIRNHVLRAFETAQVETDPEKKKQLMTVAIVGGGPTGVELAGAYVELFKNNFKLDYPNLDLSQARVVVIEATPNIMLPFSDPNDRTKASPFQTGVKAELERRGVEVMTSAAVDSVEDSVVKFKDGRTLAAGTIIWAAGVRGALLGDNLGLKMNPRSYRIEVTDYLNIEDKPEVFVIGDMASLDGFKWGSGTMPYPMLAQVAIQMGKQAAENINVLASGGAPSKFSYYDKGSMAIIGKNAAIVSAAKPFPIKLTGRGFIKNWIGWLMWLAVHVMFLFGWRNRLVAIFNWVWNWFSNDRGARVLTGRTDEKTKKVMPSP